MKELRTDVLQLSAHAIPPSQFTTSQVPFRLCLDASEPEMVSVLVLVLNQGCL